VWRKWLLVLMWLLGLVVQVVLVWLAGLLVDLCIDLMEVWLQLAEKHLEIVLSEA
jgi:type IV secretory pathway TrbL component